MVDACVSGAYAGNSVGVRVPPRAHNLLAFQFTEDLFVQAFSRNHFKMNKINLLISSVGSLVGLNILKCICEQKFNRREYLNILGTNSIAKNPHIFDCDRCYLVPESKSYDYAQTMLDIIEDEKPDIILCGRDLDTIAISKFIDTVSYKVTYPYGTLHSLNIAENKMNTWNFAQKHNLPFAESMILSKKSNKTLLNSFVKRVGFPVIAKPAHGFASKGVHFIHQIEEFNLLDFNDDYIIQEYLGDPHLLKDYFEKFRKPAALFLHAPDVWHYSAQCIIYPDKQFSEIFLSRHKLEMGKTHYFETVNDLQVAEITKCYVNALIKEGAKGLFSMQFRKDRNGKWKGFEINLRNTGATYARLLSGWDELGILISKYLPDKIFPVFNSQPREHTIIKKSLHESIFDVKKVEQLETEKKWVYNELSK